MEITHIVIISEEGTNLDTDSFTKHVITELSNEGYTITSNTIFKKTTLADLFYYEDRILLFRLSNDWILTFNERTPSGGDWKVRSYPKYYVKIAYRII
ncbi:hypothetical protein [Candidatus Harpocratesius sp.]